MSAAAEVATAAESNAHAAQDVQNMLAELKGGEERGGASKAAPGNGVEDVKDDINGDSEKNNVSGLQSEAKGSDKKQEEEGQTGERSTSDRPHRGGGRGRGRGGRGRGDYKSYKQNIKSDLTAQEETDDPVQIRKQIEFYFSDSNLPMDRFLLSQVSGSKNLPVDLKIIHSFKRMRRFQPFSAIIAALKESTFLELTDDDTKVKRKEPLAEQVDPEKFDPGSIKVFEDRAMPRTAYVKGFGEEDKDTQLGIEDFFTPYGPWNAVRLRRANDKLFKGSVFVEFDTEETLEKFLALDPKPKYKDQDLQIMSKKVYCEKKADDIKAGKIRPSNRQPHHHRGRGGGHHTKRKRDDENDRDWRERRNEDRRNGFRDSRRGGGGGNKSKHEQGKEMRKDSRGVPIVKATDDEGKEQAEDDSSAATSSRKKREAATADALAQARAVVEAQKNAVSGTDTEKREERVEEDSSVGGSEASKAGEVESGKKPVKAQETDPIANTSGGKSDGGSGGGGSSSKKRGRAEDAEEAGSDGQETTAPKKSQKLADQ